MKLKITTHTTTKKSSRILNVKHSNADNYTVLSLTLKKKDVNKTVFI